MSFAKIRPRRGTATQWTTANPVLAEGELAFEVPTEGVGTGLVKIKIGDGVTAWNELPYAVDGSIDVTDFVAQTLDGDETDKVPSVLAVKSIIDLIGIKYVKGDPDVIQILGNDGEWHDFASGGLLWNGYFYDNGKMTVPITERANYGGSSYASVTFNANTIVLKANIRSSGSSELVMSESKDVSNCDYVELKYTSTGDNKKSFILGSESTTLTSWDTEGTLQNFYKREIFTANATEVSSMIIPLGDLTPEQKSNLQVGVAVQGGAQADSTVTIYSIRAYKNS